jgi:hypothetical protein
MTITLPDDIRGRLESLARARGYESIDQMILDLVVREADELPDVRTSKLTPRTREQLEAMLDEGLPTDADVEADDPFWAERKRIILDKLAGKNGTLP